MVGIGALGFSGVAGNSSPPWPDSVIVPTTTAAAALSTSTVGATIDADLLPKLTAMAGKAVTRTTTPSAGTEIVLCLTTDAYLAANAPAKVMALVAQLDAKNPAAHVRACYSSGHVWIVAKRPAALVAAAFRYLRRLGYRALAANDAWELTPTTATHKVLGASVIEPRAYGLRYDGTSGLGPTGNPPMTGGEVPKAYWPAWNRRCGQPVEISGLATHQGESWNAAYQCDLRADRSMMAWWGGARGMSASGAGSFPTKCFTGGAFWTSKPCCSSHGDGVESVLGTPPEPPWTGLTQKTKGCVTDTDPADCSAAVQDPGTDSGTSPHTNVYAGTGGAIGRWAEWVIAVLAQRIQTYGTDDPGVHYISSEAADGGADCRCDKCVNLLRNGPYAAYLTSEQQTQDASVADNYFHFQNSVAQAVTDWYAGYPYGISVDSYTTRSAIPVVPIKPTILVQLVPAALDAKSTNLSEEEFHHAWEAKRDANPWGPFPLSVTKQWELAASNWDAPAMSPRHAHDEATWALDAGCVAFTVQNTYSLLIGGLKIYLLNEMFWEPGVTADSILDDFFERAFGAAKVPVRRMFERWWTAFEWSGLEYGRSCRDMLEAQTLATAAGVDAATQTRLDHVKAYVQWITLHERKLYYQPLYTADPGTYQAAYEAALEACYLHIWGCWDFQVLHSFRLHRSLTWDTPGNHYPSDLTNDPGSLAERWFRNAPKDTRGWADVVEPSSAELQSMMVAGEAAWPEVVTRPTWSANLAPLALSGDSSLVITTQLQAPYGYEFAAYKSGAGDQVIELNTGSTGSPLPVRVLITDPDGVLTTVEVPVTTTQTYYNVTLSGPAGVYRITTQTNDGAIYWKWRVPKTVPFVSVDQRNSVSGFQNYLKRLYFYLPPGETKVVLQYDTQKTIQFYNPSGTPVTTTKVGAYQWQCDVGEGLDGAVWSFDGAQDREAGVRFVLENCPPYVAYSPEQMMVPAELLP